MGKNKIKIGLIQSEVEKGIDRNLEKTERLAKEASSKGADIVCLQELFAMKYFAQTKNKGFFKFAEHTPGRITNFLSETAKRNKIVLIGSLFEKNIGGKYYNTCLIFDENGKIICKYRKVHVPYDPCYYEQFYFSNGNLGFVQCTAKGVKIAPLICYDQWFPEAARVNAVNGAKIIFYPTAIGWIEEMKKNEPWSLKRWENAMCAHASMNGVFVAAANRVGKEEDINFWGSSFIADPFGEVIARASESEDTALVAEIDLKKVYTSQEGWGFLKNRQPKFYGQINL